MFGRFASPLLGVHNVRNAVAAIAVGSYVGISASDLADGLRAFKGSSGGSRWWAARRA